jgi:hypothetical protein
MSETQKITYDSLINIRYYPDHQLPPSYYLLTIADDFDTPLEDLKKHI